MKRASVNAKANLKSEIIELAGKKWSLRVRLERLKAKGSETGDERCQLREDYNEGPRRQARATQLAYGLLRGRRYVQIEQKCHEAPDAYRILKALHGADESPDKELKAAYSLTDIITWLDPVAFVVENWKKVDQLCAQGKGDTEEADEVRDEIDWPWCKLMTPEDHAKAKAIIQKLSEKRDGVAA
jgi:hypothetical protein